ncbi:MAG: rhodanese-like domain-containing protein [Candidatus Omnitrophica bacterium]|nr:rhodanese-like domain-containing protein [Candidatus Omnitrophota bacterium]
MRGILIFAVSLILMSAAFYNTGYSAETPEAAKGTFEQVFNETPLKDGIKEISYEQFQKIRASGEKYFLFDVLSYDSYEEGHIEGAKSFPLNTISEKTANEKMPKGANVVVYCASFQCSASSAAADRLSKLGYKALDYKGGLKEWQGKGNELVK